MIHNGQIQTPKQVVLTGQIGIVQTVDGSKALLLTTGPLEQYIIPIPDTLPPGAPSDAKTAKQVIVDGLSGVEVVREMPRLNEHRGGGR